MTILTMMDNVKGSMVKQVTDIFWRRLRWQRMWLALLKQSMVARQRSGTIATTKMAMNVCDSSSPNAEQQFPWEQRASVRIMADSSKYLKTMQHVHDSISICSRNSSSSKVPERNSPISANKHFYFTGCSCCQTRIIQDFKWTDEISGRVENNEFWFWVSKLPTENQTQPQDKNVWASSKKVHIS